jgi:hypothetical protein
LRGLLTTAASASGRLWRRLLATLHRDRQLPLQRDGTDDHGRADRHAGKNTAACIFTHGRNHNCVISRRDHERAPSSGHATIPSRARWFAAVVSIFYGFARLNGSQFTVLDSELARPMGDVSGFWLTWYYFGYSAFYGAIIALVQIGGGILLTVIAPYLQRLRATVELDTASYRQVHHFEVDQSGIVRVWQTWLDKGGIMEGHLLPDGDVQLDATAGATMGNVRLHRTAAPHDEPSILAAFRRQRP